MADREDPVRAALARELYWAEEATRLRRMTAAEARDALHDLAVLLRADERSPVPRGEPNLASISRWRRRLKVRLFRLLRPITRRYDRLLGDLAELTAALAARVAEAEAEVARLREARGERGGAGPGEEA
ncbi:MAG TPA: hypothetical protein VNO79_15730 [Actinomycetota bacterium]|nr:hypothetical protein [Actinomycetota bacterium]